MSRYPLSIPALKRDGEFRANQLNLLYDFSKEIQDRLESTVDVSSTLMAEENSTISNLRLLFHPSRFIKEPAVFPESPEEESSRIECKQIGSTSEVISYQNNFSVHSNRIANTNADPMEVSLIKNSGSQDSLHQTSMREVGSSTNSSAQISTMQIGAGQVNIGQVSSTQVSSTQIGISEIGTTQIDTYQVRSTQINIPQVSIFHRHSDEGQVREITFPSRISSQQGFPFDQFSLSSHLAL